ncbi:hypothetical protein [Lysinibacillus sp. FSL K6-0102]|uniref:hypothetical protein n=1 Tax=Lysinibacillus sp. FSL K6-0102 TaxID=2975290 RepID=UPI0028E5B14F|nr:hypothetical protein [uncultured Lysinibacillus sp.]
MKYSAKLNQFLVKNSELTNEQKAEKVANLDTDDLFDLMRNIEEAQDKYDRMVIKAVAGSLLAKNIFLV